MAGVYIHIPLCRSFCVYCDFYSERLDISFHRSVYVDALIREIEEKRVCFKGVPPNTIYFGGGTPSLLSIEDLSRILDSLRFNFYKEVDFSPEEITIEVNPDDITPEYAKGLRSIGFNRISMGVQSFDDRSLKWMGRRYESKQIYNAFESLRAAGFENISLDIIFGYDSGHGMSYLKRDIRKLIALSPEHISCYQLTLEEGTELDRMNYQDLDQDICREQYEFVAQSLRDAGYEHYEISNFAKKGLHSKHNSSYWTHEDYIGLGASAHSYRSDIAPYGARAWNPSNLKDYLARPEACDQQEVLSKENYIDEKIMLGLRTAKGVNVEGILSESVLDSLLTDEAFIYDKPNLRLKPQYYFVSDYYIAKVVNMLD